MLALPLQVGAVRLGALCLYRSTPGRWDNDGTATAMAYADAAVAVLLLLQAQTQPGPALHPELDEPAEYRAEVHQATGFLSVQASVGLAEALLLLRAHAFASEPAAPAELPATSWPDDFAFSPRRVKMDETRAPRNHARPLEGQSS